jgi:hypothetical protein
MDIEILIFEDESSIKSAFMNDVAFMEIDRRDSTITIGNPFKNTILKTTSCSKNLSSRIKLYKKLIWSDTKKLVYSGSKNNG